jgi:hypothetical protein
MEGEHLRGARREHPERESTSSQGGVFAEGFFRTGTFGKSGAGGPKGLPQSSSRMRPLADVIRCEVPAARGEWSYLFALGMRRVRSSLAVTRETERERSLEEARPVGQRPIRLDQIESACRLPWQQTDKLGRRASTRDFPLRWDGSNCPNAPDLQQARLRLGRSSCLLVESAWPTLGGRGVETGGPRYPSAEANR